MLIKGKKKAKSAEVKKIVKPAKKHGKFYKFFASIGGYFKGSWAELKQVRWPDRKTTWGMSLAVIVFTGFFIVMIIVLDIAFKELLNLIIK